MSTHSTDARTGHGDASDQGQHAGRRQRRAHKGAQFVVELGPLRNATARTRPFVGDGTLEELEISGSRVAPDEPIHVEATIEAVHDGVLVSGTAKTRWQGTCRRCLEDAMGPISVTFRELCVEDGDEETTYPLGVEQLELDQIVHDACILDLPLAPLCDENCLGICAQCGVNRNVEVCSCTASVDPRWSALSGLNNGQTEPDAGPQVPDHRS